MTADPIRPPRAGLLLLETRALLELAALLPAYPFLRRAPRGDGHPVLVLPGFMASDFSTRTLRRFLRDLGYAAHGWKLGRNVGPSPELVGRLVERLQELRARHGRRISLIGWSLGGIYARELARTSGRGGLPAHSRRAAPGADDGDLQPDGRYRRMEELLSRGGAVQREPGGRKQPSRYRA